MRTQQARNAHSFGHPGAPTKHGDEHLHAHAPLGRDSAREMLTSATSACRKGARGARTGPQARPECHERSSSAEGAPPRREVRGTAPTRLAEEEHPLQPSGHPEGPVRGKKKRRRRENLRGAEAPTQGRRSNVMKRVRTPGCTRATERPNVCAPYGGLIQSRLPHSTGSAGHDAYAA